MYDVKSLKAEEFINDLKSDPADDSRPLRKTKTIVNSLMKS